MTSTLYAALRYKDARKAVHWLADAFGLQLGSVYPPEGEAVDHAVMFCDHGGIMFGSMRENDYPLQTAAATPGQSMGIYVVVDEIDAHYARARRAGAEIVIQLGDTEYGSREYTARDFEGHLWSFGTYDPQRPTD